MRPTLLLIAFLAALPGHAWGTTPACASDQTEIIVAEGDCLEVGLSVGYQREGSSKVLCLESSGLQNACGSDGGLAKRHAFANWMGQVKTFEASCEAKGGSFSYQNPSFEEPQDESFCSAPEPVAAPNMLEDTLCNYHSRCPPTPLLCSYSCKDR